MTNFMRLISVSIGLFTSGTLLAADTEAPRTAKLAKAGKIAIGREQCAGVERKLGQLLYVNVDGFNTASGEAIDPAYVRMIKELQLGGVLPKPATYDVNKMRTSYRKLQESSREPLLIGIDYHMVSGGAAKEQSKQFGLGFGGGMLATDGYLGLDCLESRAYLEAFLHRASGLNQALGPTIERGGQFGDFLKQSSGQVAPSARRLVNAFNELGVVTTTKHYPHTPDTYNLHTASEDTRIPRTEVSERLKIFKDVANESDLLMTTHLYNSNVDKNDMATFSPEWMRILREDLGYRGLVMTDALFMFQSYSASTKQMASRWPQDQVPMQNDQSIFAARSILAGHDFALLEGSAASTYRVFDDLLYVACQDKPIALEFRRRVDESYRRITEWKRSHAKNLRESKDIPNPMISEANQLLNPDRGMDFSSTHACPDKTKVDEFKSRVARLGLSPLARPKPVRATDAPGALPGPAAHK